MVNRRQRRARTARRPHAGDSPKQQMRDFLQQPGKFHIVELPDEKSFVVKVTEREMPLFLTICGQLKGVLGHCEVTPATPVDASIADPGTIARQTANDPYRLKLAQDRTDAAEAERFDNPELDAALARHPAGKRRPAGGRHAKQEPDTTFERLAAAAVAGDDAEAQARLASIELAAAQAESVKAAEALDAANARLAEVYERSGEIHNRRVLDGFTERAGEAIAEKFDDEPPTAADLEPDAPGHVHEMTCSRDTCDWTGRNLNAAALLNEYTEHIHEHAKAEALAAEDDPHAIPEHDHSMACSLDPECDWSQTSNDQEVLLRNYGRHAIEDHGHNS